MSDHVQLESYDEDEVDEDEVIIRAINENTQLLIDLEEQRMGAVSKLRDALEAYKSFLEREANETARWWIEDNGRPF